MKAIKTLLKRTLAYGFSASILLPCSVSFASDLSYKIVDTGQTKCYNTSAQISAPSSGSDFYGQDAQHDGYQPSYKDNGDGTVTDLNTGLMWQQSPDHSNKLSLTEAEVAAGSLTLGGYTDWRVPTIKELYSLINFDGWCGTSESTSSPFIDTDYFDFAYGDESAGERLIDAQYLTSTKYVSTTMNGHAALFGVNFADGRIKGYGYSGGKAFYVRFVRGGNNYGENNFTDNGDNTITDKATGLMWSQADSGEGLNWVDALAWVQAKNSETHLGYNDWRLPNAKEMQSIVDYTRSPDTTNSPALDPIFDCSSITNEGDEKDYPFFWTSTTHLDGPSDIQANGAVYIAFGRALGFMSFSGSYELMDVHGAGAQRSDPKAGDPDDYPYGFGPQGDVRRIYNYVRLVRDTPIEEGDDDDSESDDDSEGDEGDSEGDEGDSDDDGEGGSDSDDNDDGDTPTPSTMQLTAGSVISISASDLGLSFFSKKPKISALIDGKKKRMQIVEKVSKNNTASTVTAVLKKGCKLYDNKTVRSRQLSSLYADAPLSDLKISAIIVNVDGTEQLLPGSYYLANPVINSISGSPESSGDEFTIEGQYFGTSAPKVYVECLRNGKAIYKRCKVNKTTSLLYMNAYGKTNASCMKIFESDIDSNDVGYSSVTVTYPKLPTNAEPTGYFVIMNNIGIAVSE